MSPLYRSGCLIGAMKVASSVSLAVFSPTMSVLQYKMKNMFSECQISYNTLILEGQLVYMYFVYLYDYLC